MGRISARFKEIGNETRVAAQQNTLAALGGDEEAVRRQFEAHPERLHGLSEEEKKASLERQLEAARTTRDNPQPLTTKLMDYYSRRGMRPDMGGNRDQRALAGIGLVGTPQGAEFEQRLQKIYDTVKPGDQRSLENALLDAKALLLSKIGDKDVGVWDDLAENNARFAETDPVGYHQRLNKQIVSRYASAGMDEETAYKKLMQETLDNGVMGKLHTHEATLMMEADELGKRVARMENEGVAKPLMEATRKEYEAATEKVKYMEALRFEQVDKEIADLKAMLEMDSPPISRVEIRDGIAKLEAARAGFINPNAKIEAAYAKFQDGADSALPQGTPLEKLKRLYAEKQWDRRQIIKRIKDAEGGNDVRGAAQEMLNTFGGLLGQYHNADHRRLVQLEAEMKDLAPIVFLNESPAIRDDKAGFKPSAWNGMLSMMGGQGSPLSGTSRQEDALMLQRNLQIAGIAPEMLNDPKMPGIADRTADPGLLSSEFWGDNIGKSFGLMFHILMAQQLTKGLGMGKTIETLVNAGNRVMKSGKVGGATLALFGDAVESGLTYHTAGIVNVDNNEELQFMGGFFGGAAGSLGKNGFNAAKKAVAGVFGDKADDAAKMIIDFGAQRLGSGVGESSEETLQQIVQLWQGSSTGQEFWEKMGKQFGDLSEATKFYVSTMVMGGFMGGAHSDGLGKYLKNYADQQLSGMSPPDRNQAESAAAEFANESEALIEGAQSEEAVQQEIGTDESKPAMEMTPEAQAAEAEMERLRKTREAVSGSGEISQTDSQGKSEADYVEGLTREDVRQLEERLKRTDLTEQERANAERDLNQRKMALEGFEQMRNQTAFREVVPAVEAETETANGGKETPANTVEIEGVQIELPTIPGTQTPVQETTETVSGEVVPPAGPVVETPAQEAPKRRDQEIADQINEFFSNLAGTIGANAAEKIKEYADRIIANPENRETILQGQTEKSIEMINKAVELQLNQTKSQEVDGEVDAKKSLADWAHSDSNRNRDSQKVRGKFKNHVIGKWIDKLGNIYQGVKRGKTPDTYIFQDVETGEEVELAADEVVPFMSEDYEAHTKSKQQAVETPAAGIETPTTQQVTAAPQTQQGSPAIDVGTAMDVGLQVAERLAENNLYTRENWTRAMQTYGEAMAPHLERAWEFTSRRIKEGTVKKSKETKKKSGERGTYATIEQYSDANPDSVNQAIATVDRSYKRMNLGELFDEAAQAIKAAGGYIKGYASILEESIDNAGLQMQQAKRFLAIRFFGEYADQLQQDIDQETDPGKKEELTKLRDKAVQMLDSVMQRAAESNTWMGQATAATAQWRFLLENTAGYSRAAIDRYNKALMNETSASGELTTRAKKRRAKKKEITNSMDESIDGIGESSAVDSVASDIVEERDVKPKERKPSAKKTGLGMTRSQIDEMKAKALEDLRKAARSGMAGALGTTAVFDFMDAAGRYGVALMAEGVVTFKEWSARMKADIPELTDAQAREAWENQRHEGKTLAELAKEEIQAAATPRTRTAAQKETLRSRIKKTINNHFKKDAAPMTLEQRLVDEVGLTPEEAAYVTEAVQGELQKRMDARIKQKAKALKRKPAQTDRAKPKSDTQRAVEAMVDGELTDQMVQEIFADRLGLQRQLTPEEMAKARALGKALAATTPNTRSEAVAALALDRFMWQVLPAPGMLEQFWEIFKSIVYANMLMGIPTHMKNVMSAGAMTVYGLVEPIANMSKWKRSMREAWKAKDGERLRTLLRSSPFTEMAVKFTALGRGWAKGARIAWDIMKTGFLDSKYIDKQQVRKKAGEPSALGRLSPMLERMKFRGIMYPANIFKYVGRALSAEDAWMTAINLEMELADAVRRHSIESDKRGFAALTRDVNRRMAKSNPDYSDALKEATEQIDEISSALEMTAFERDQAIKIRAREILVDKLKLTEAERQQAEDIARSRVFTLTRGGVWGKTADLMKKINSMKGIGLVSWIWMPFTTIIGNLGDTFNDFFPIYGVLRANGISPTALAQSLGMSKSSAMMADRLEGTIGERAAQMMGSRNDQRYYEQMGRAWFGAISLLAAFMLMDDDDDDDFIRFSGKDDPHHKNFIFIGGKPIVSWELIPPIAPVAAIVSEANSYHKRHPKEERSIAGRILYAMGSVEQSVAGLSVAESAQNLNQVVGTALSSLTGVGNYGDPVDLSKGIQNVAKELGKSGIDMLGRVNPLRNPIVGQIQQIFDPRAYSHSDILQSLEYAALGVIYRYTNDKEGNPKMAMVDIFGEEVERMPAEDAIGFLDRFKNDKSKDSRWKFLVDHGVADKLSRPQNTTLLFADPDDEFGVVAEKMSDFEYGTYARIAGNIFSKKLKDYMADEDQWKQDYEKVEVTKTGTRTELEKYILKIMSESRTEAKDEMDELPASKGGFKNTRL